MRNFKVDPFYEGPRSKVWPRNKVYTLKEVDDRCRKTNAYLEISGQRRYFIKDSRRRVITRLVTTTRQASSHVEPESVKAYVVVA